MVDQLVGTFVGRWYFTIFGVMFAVLAVRFLGAKRAAIYTVVAIAVGALAENGSVLMGFPYTSYSFNQELRGQELWIVDVPLIVPLSYTFGAYFAFTAARLIVSGPFCSRGRSPVLEYLLAVVLATWAIWILDPVMRLGRYHVVGELFQYSGPGFWFGLPLGSQVGFFCMNGIVIAALAWMTRDEAAVPVQWLRHPQLVASLNYVGQVLFAVGCAFFVARTQGGPTSVAADSLAGAASIIAIPMVLLVAIYWKSLAQSEGATRAPAGSAEQQGTTSRTIRADNTSR